MGLRLTIIRAFPSPERQGERRWVSFEFRKGTWLCFALSARKQSVRQARDLLIACASLSAAPVAHDRATRSDPARSTYSAEYPDALRYPIRRLVVMGYFRRYRGSLPTPVVAGLL